MIRPPLSPTALSDSGCGNCPSELTPPLVGLMARIAAVWPPLTACRPPTITTRPPRKAAEEWVSGAGSRPSCDTAPLAGSKLRIASLTLVPSVPPTMTIRPPTTATAA
jgi:hypothetical protein